MNNDGLQKKIVLGLGCVVAASGASYGGGFGVKLMSAVTSGMANAGSGVIDDPLASFINPASMILNNCHHAAIETSGVFPNAPLKGTGVLTQGPFTLLNLTQKCGNIAQPAAIPAGGFVAKIHDRIRVGIAAGAPYGLEFNYGHHSPAQFYLINTKMQTINIVPSLAVRVFDWLSLGAGFQAQWVKVDLKKRKVFGFLTTGIGNVKGDAWNYGFTAGLLLQPMKQWNIGFSYRSKIDSDLRGHFKSPFLNARARARIHFPHIFTLSTSVALTPEWTFYMDAIRTLWYTTRNITIRVLSAGGIIKDFTPQNWRSTWFISGGMEYKLNSCWAIRGGLGYDKTPTRNSTRIPAIPDANRTWLAIGATYTYHRYSATISYGHEFFNKAKINLALPNSGTLNGHVKPRINIVALQLNAKI